ncbi:MULTISPECIES: hypothetical protein [Rhodococcus]|uniref:hypothetical protein n=1 Tax=Rhodococcus TaxID=1827 RepID=UPI00135BA751|nr:MULTISPECIES: hypothetical protein [Rhodococcus]KAF0957564.1 hypothetical protein MLGJGCBP_09396 [Rhodococcus sp. T7]KAF0963739.1 hypothetical protein MLGJGCBP_03135 [Rhodococcus sp. T7]QQZ18232.1 hypothetical protein GO592_38955 [Rhodococcus sp. 21391]UOT08161.1 hypothetical protein MPY17_38050 [Rhodococcus opacus]
MTITAPGCTRTAHPEERPISRLRTGATIGCAAAASAAAPAVLVTGSATIGALTAFTTLTAVAAATVMI